MEKSSLPFSAIPQFSKRDKAYVSQDPVLQPFYLHTPDLPNFEKAIRHRDAYPTDRNLLLEVWQDQYAHRNPSENIRQQIQSMESPRTYTVATAHQPSLFTGPLYYIYKALSTINLAERLCEAIPEAHFVPVFISGGEDHDFEEINHFHLFGKRVEWNNGESGAVGRMSTDSLQEVLVQTRAILGDAPNAVEIYEILAETHRPGRKYGEAALDLAHRLFEKYGMLVLDMDDARLKKAFVPNIKKEIFEQPSQPLIEAAGQQLEKAGFGLQAHPRAINFFYLGEQYRNRIVREGTVFKVLNTPLEFSEAALEEEIKQHPERFSPNVVMRPIYQEHILPNLAYVGGGGEIAYWLERKAQFAAFAVPYPILIRRHSALWVDKGTCRKMDKLGITVKDLLQEEEATVKAYVRRHAGEPLSLSGQKKELSGIFQTVVEVAQKVDPTLVKKVKAEMAANLNSLNELEGRLIKAEKDKQEVSVRQIRSLYARLFPDRGLQERHANFLELYVKHGRHSLEVLKNSFPPFQNDFVVIKE